MRESSPDDSDRRAATDGSMAEQNGKQGEPKNLADANAAAMASSAGSS